MFTDQLHARLHGINYGKCSVRVAHTKLHQQHNTTSKGTRERWCLRLFCRVHALRHLLPEYFVFRNAPYRIDSRRGFPICYTSMSCCPGGYLLYFAFCLNNVTAHSASTPFIYAQESCLSNPESVYHQPQA